MSHLPGLSRSMRFRITVPSVVIVAAVLTVLALYLIESVHAHLISEVDGGLINEAHYVRAQTAAHQFLPPTAPKGEFGQFFLADGKLLGESANLKGAPPLLHVMPTGPTPRFVTITSSRFGRLRILEEQFGHGSAPIFVEAQQIDEIADATHSLSVRVGVGVPLLVLAVGTLIWLVVGRAMKTVETVRTAVAGIVDVNSNERVSNPHTGDELERLVVTMNIMLDRVQEGVARERRFVADASHELRSPIAAARTIIESEQSSVGAPSSTYSAALEALQRLQDIADELLILDRAGQHDVDRPLQLVDVDEWVFAIAEQLRRSTPLTVDTSAVSGGQVFASEIDVMRIIENLASNAAHHALSTVAFSLLEQGGWTELRVTDDGQGVPMEMKDAIFERFRRLENHRGRTHGGSGLGLAIVRDLTIKYEGTVRVEDPKSGGSCFVVILPTSHGGMAK